MNSEPLDNQHLLLMYLADELPRVEHRRVEAMLAADASLAAMLQELHGAQQSLEQGLSELDSADPLPASADAAARWISRAVRQHGATLAARPVAPERAHHFKRLRWALPAAAAAAILVAGVLWIDRHMGTMAGGPVPTSPIVRIDGMPSQSAPAATTMQSDANYALWIESFEPLPGTATRAAEQPEPAAAVADDDAPHRTHSGGDDLIAQDDVSQYLLARTTQQ